MRITSEVEVMLPQGYRASDEPTVVRSDNASAPSSSGPRDGGDGASHVAGAGQARVDGESMCATGRFAHRPRGADRWELLESQGWLLRTHGRGRVRPFHPLHRSCPCEGSALTGERWTILFNEGGQREVIKDDWNCQRTWQRPGQWFGFTLLKMQPLHGRQSAHVSSNSSGGSRSQQSSQSMPVQRSFDDGTFEKPQGTNHLSEDGSDGSYEVLQDDVW